MEQYVKLADIYDYLVQGIDYNEWYEYMYAIAQKFDTPIKTMLDLACGTGNTTLPFARKGIRAYGVDLSEAMLAKAQDKANQEGLQKAVFLKQDMRILQLPEQVDLVTCYHDGLNYITSLQDLTAVFKRAYISLRSDGLFIFDMNAVSKLAAGVTSETTFLDDEPMSLVWETGYSKDEELWEIRLTGFIKKGQLYEKFYEVHQEKYYSRAEVVGTLNQAGFKLLAEYHGFSFEPPNPSTRRIFYVARKGN